MTNLRLKPTRGGFLRPFGCGWFIKQFLAGNGPYSSPAIDPKVGAPQADIFFEYKNALRRETAMNLATKAEEKQAKKKKRPIDPEDVNRLYQRYLARIPYKAKGSRYHSFVVYFSNLVRLGWVESTGKEEHSALQSNYPSGQPRKYYRLTTKGLAASDAEWSNPLATFYR